MLHYLTTDIGSMISYTRLRPSTALNMGIAGGLAWHLTYNRMFIGMPDITGPAGLDVTEESWYIALGETSIGIFSPDLFARSFLCLSFTQI